MTREEFQKLTQDVVLLDLSLIHIFTSDCSVYSRDDSVVDVTGCTIDGNEVSFMELFTSKCEFLVFFVHSDITASGYTALTDVYKRQVLYFSRFCKISLLRRIVRSIPFRELPGI